MKLSRIFLLFLIPLTLSFGIRPDKTKRLHEELPENSIQSTRTRNYSLNSNYFNGNEWYIYTSNEGGWGVRPPNGFPGGSWPRGSNNWAFWSAGLWISFQDDQNIVQFSGYNGSSDFTPGPYGTMDSYNNDHRIYKVNRWDQSETDWQEWPVDLGAPYTDVNGDGVYDAGVDEPYVPLDQTLYSVYNDSTEHSVYGTSINGIEVHQTIFGGADTQDQLSRTFYIQYEIINKGGLTWHNAKFGPWSDVDLGDFQNDAVGVDVERDMVYCYSNQPGADDNVFGTSPAVAFRYIGSINNASQDISAAGCMGPDCDNNSTANLNSSYDINQEQTFWRMSGLDNNGNAIIDPVTGEETAFTHTGDPVAGTGWLDQVANDRQMFFSVAPNTETVEPGDTVSFVMAVIIQTGLDHLDAVNELRTSSDIAKASWENNFQDITLVDRPILEADEPFAFGVFSDFTAPPADPEETVVLERIFRNGGNIILDVNITSDVAGFSMLPQYVAIDPGDNATIGFSYTAENFTTNTYNVPDEYNTIQGAVDVALETNFEGVFSLLDNDNYNAQEFNISYSLSGDTILVEPGYYMENIFIDNKSINLIANDGNPKNTVIDGGNQGKVIDVENFGGLFYLNGFTIQNALDNYDGGGLSINDGEVLITNNVFRHNTSDYGGGIYSWYATGEISRNVFEYNNANVGSAVRLNQGSIHFYNNTLWGNNTDGWGVGAFRSINHRIINNIIFDYIERDYQYIQLNNSDVVVEYNNVKNGFNGEGNINSWPEFVSPEDGDFRLFSNSPSVDTGDPDLDNDGQTYEVDTDDQDPDGSRMNMGSSNEVIYTIADARALGDEVSLTVVGVITSQNRTVNQTAFTMQDSTAGINIFLPDIVVDLEYGDFTSVTGVITDYNGTLNIYPENESDIQVLSENHPLPDYQILTIEEYLVSGDDYESELIRFSNVHYTGGEWLEDAGESFGMYISDDGGISTTTMWIDKDTEIDGMDQPIEPFYVSGVGEEYNGALNIRPQDYHDFSTTTDPGFENSNSQDNGWQRLPTFWESYHELGSQMFTIEKDGTNIFNSDDHFSAYDGSYSLKMWGSYAGGENMEHSIFQTFEGESSLPPGTKMGIEAQMMSHLGDWIGQGTNSIALFAKYFSSDYTYLGGEYSTEYNGSFEANVWHQIDLEFTVPQETDIVQIGVSFYQENDNQHGSVYIDNLTAYQRENAILSTSTEHTVHGDTALVEVSMDHTYPSFNAINLSFSGFQDKLVFNDIVSEGYMFGDAEWITVVNNTETLLITASAGATPITDNGVLFALKLIIPDTLSTQYVPVVIEDFLGNEDVTEGSFINGGVEVVWEPIAEFSSDTTNGYLPLTINFTDLSEIGTYPISEWEWHFGDDSVAFGSDVQHTYLEEGNYTVTLVVTDEFGLSDTLEMVDYITAIFPVHPTAGFAVSTTSGDYPLDIVFTDTSTIGTYPIVDWIWDFGNDSTGVGSEVSSTYERPGEFDVSLMVTDEYGLSDTLILTDFVQVDTTFGDIDWNTMVQSFDASFILKHLAEMIELDELQLQIADVTQDETISPLDATVILQYVVGLVGELPFTPDESYSAAGDLTMSDQGAEPGMQIEIPINITNGSNIYGFTGNLVYDPSVVSLDTILFSDYLDGYLFELNEINPGEIRIVSAGGTPDGETGVFATLVATVGDNFTEETSIIITDLRWNEGSMNETPIEMTISFGLGIDVASIPDVFALHQNYPNPFNPTTQIKYDLPENELVSIVIYDVMGRKIRSLVNNDQTAGYHTIRWDAKNDMGEGISAGMYIYTIQAGEFRSTKKMILLK